MSIANRIVTILVFLAAIAAGVLGYMLFEKRNNAKENLDNVARHVIDNTKKLNDSMSKTRGVKIEDDAFAINKGADSVNSGLAVFDNSVRNIIEQKNKLAKAISETAKIAELDGADDLTEKALLDAAVSQETLDKLVAAVTAKSNADRKFRADVRRICMDVFVAFELKDFVDEAKVNSDDVAHIEDIFKKVIDIYLDYVKTKKEYRAYVGKISDALGLEPVSGSTDLQETAVEQIKKIQDLVAQLADAKKKIEEMTKIIETKDQEIGEKTKLIADLNKQIAAKEEKIEGLEKEIKEKQGDIDRLKGLVPPLGPNGGGEVEDKKIAVVDYTPIEKLRTVEGVVAEVYPESGLCLIKLNKVDGKSVVLVEGQYLTTATSLKPDAQMTGRVRFYKAGCEDKFFTQILNTPNGRMPQVGDVVIMTEHDFADSGTADKVSGKTGSK